MEHPRRRQNEVNQRAPMWKHQFQKSQIASFIARSTSFENRNGLQSWPVNVLLARWSVWSTPGILFVSVGENVHVLVCYGSVTSDPCPQGSHSSMSARKSLRHVRKEVTQACPQGSHSSMSARKSLKHVRKEVTQACPQGSHSSMSARKSLKHVRKEVTQAVQWDVYTTSPSPSR